MTTEVALVSKDPDVRLAAVLAFEELPEFTLKLHQEAPSTSELVLWGSDMEQSDGIVFDPSDIAGALAGVRAAVAVSGRGRVIAVRSGSGGAGCTTVGLHLSARLARNRRVCLIELDPFGALRTRLGIDPRSKSWADAGGTGDDLLLAALPVPGGARVLLAPGDGAAIAPDLVERTAAVFDVVVLDASRAPVPYPCWVHLLVIPPTKPGCANAVRALSDVRVRWGLILNRTGSGGSLTRRGAESLLERRVLTELPCTPSLRDAEDEGRLMDGPWYRWSRRMDLIAAAVTQP